MDNRNSRATRRAVSRRARPPPALVIGVAPAARRARSSRRRRRGRVRAQRLRAHRAGQHRHRRSCKHIEFGQGPYTGVATILADELDADWAQIRVESAPGRRRSSTPTRAFGVQGTGGSTAMANSWDQLRKAGAEARARLIAAAAAAWKVDAERDHHRERRRQARLRQVRRRSASSSTAAQRDARPSASPSRRNPAPGAASATHVPKVDTVPKTNGTAQYTIDVKLPDMLTCVDRASAALRRARRSRSMPPPRSAVKGVNDVVAVPQGVAVLADGYLGRHARAATR